MNLSTCLTAQLRGCWRNSSPHITLQCHAMAGPSAKTRREDSISSLHLQHVGDRVMSIKDSWHFIQLWPVISCTNQLKFSLLQQRISTDLEGDIPGNQIFVCLHSCVCLRFHFWMKPYVWFPWHGCVDNLFGYCPTSTHSPASLQFLLAHQLAHCLDILHEL